MSHRAVPLTSSASVTEQSRFLHPFEGVLQRLAPVWLKAGLRPLRPYTYHLFLLGLIPTALYLDVRTQNVIQQDVLGVGAFLILLVSTRFSSKQERRQVW